jgi:hypothetical protein
MGLDDDGQPIVHAPEQASERFGNAPAMAFELIGSTVF